MKTFLLRLAALSSLALVGCTFSRDVVNPDVREMDVSWIEPGVTTRADVVARLGLPPTVRGLCGVGKDQLRWMMIDTSTKGFEAGYILTPTFEFSDEDIADDILIRFDKKDRVSLVSRTSFRNGRRQLLEWKEAK